MLIFGFIVIENKLDNVFNGTFEEPKYEVSLIHYDGYIKDPRLDFSKFEFTFNKETIVVQYKIESLTNILHINEEDLRLTIETSSDLKRSTSSTLWKWIGDNEDKGSYSESNKVFTLPINVDKQRLNAPSPFYVKAL